MRPLGKRNQQWTWADRFLTYAQRFDIVPQPGPSGRDPSTQMYVLKRALRSSADRMGDIIPLTNIRAFANLVPRFGATADPRLTMFNTLEHSREFLLNRFFDKNIYYPLSL